MSKTSLGKEKIKILLLEGVHPSAIQAFRNDGYHEIECHAKSLAPADLLKSVEDAYFLGVRSATQLTAELLAHAPKLTGIGCFCIGTNQVDLDAAQDRGIPVFNAPFSNTRSVAELVIAETIMLMRGIPQRSAAAHRGGWIKTATGSFEVRGKVLGIVGYGHIGTQVGVLAESVGMHVVYYDLETKLALGNARPVATLDALLECADVVTMHVPETLQTFRMMGPAQFARMKPGARFINAARGTIVDIDALVETLKNKHLAGAAIGGIYMYSYMRGQDWGLWMNKVYRRFMGLFHPNRPVKKTKSIKEKVFYNTGNRVPYSKTANLTQQRVDEILDKINQKGYKTLTPEEKDILRRAGEEGL